jgi:hypothetical protein
MTVNSEPILVFLFSVALVLGTSVFAVHSGDATYHNVHRYAVAGYTYNANDNAVKQSSGFEHGMDCGQCGTSCAHCVAVTPGSCPTTTCSSAQPGSPAPMLKPLLAESLPTRPPKARA